MRLVLQRIVLVCLLTAGGVSPAAAQAALSDAEVRDLQVWREPGGYRVSYQIEGAFPEEVLERLHSGIAVSFRHRLELLGKRPVPLWPPRELSRTIIVTTAVYDSLTKQYQLTREVESEARGIRGKIEFEPETRTTPDLDEVSVWMSELHEVLLLYPDEDVGTARKVEVASSLGRRWVLGMFPTQHTASAEHVITP